MSDEVIKVIMSLKNKNVQHKYPESEPCDECGVDNVWNLSFSAFVDHLVEHRARESYTQKSHTQRNGNPEFFDHRSDTPKEYCENDIKKVRH